MRASITEQLAGRGSGTNRRGAPCRVPGRDAAHLEATFSLIERTGSLDPSMRDILAASGISTQAFYRCSVEGRTECSSSSTKGAVG